MVIILHENTMVIKSHIKDHLSLLIFGNNETKIMKKQIISPYANKKKDFPLILILQGHPRTLVSMVGER